VNRRQHNLSSNVNDKQKTELALPAALVEAGGAGTARAAWGGGRHDSDLLVRGFVC
jgi:hypothetical protein